MNNEYTRVLCNSLRRILVIRRLHKIRNLLSLNTRNYMIHSAVVFTSNFHRCDMNVHLTLLRTCTYCPKSQMISTIAPDHNHFHCLVSVIGVTFHIILFGESFATIRVLLWCWKSQFRRIRKIRGHLCKYTDKSAFQPNKRAHSLNENTW